ncbi:7491_t:CDS:2 [Entrophospora sp. SA101]|nr:7491_t:CDS:2 [Entrophospora sp. SA101]
MLLPYSVGWQELKDLFRNAGNIIRADILVGQDRRSKGSGTVLFETPEDAANAISATTTSSLAATPASTTAGGGGNSTTVGGGIGGFNPIGGGGGFNPLGGGGGGEGHSNPETTTFDTYGQVVAYGGDFSGTTGAGGMIDYRVGRRGGGEFSTAGYPAAAYTGTFGSSAGFYPTPGLNTSTTIGTQIFVRNLPFNTTNLDLRELFKHCGNVVRAEILPKGAGLVQFDSNESARFAVGDGYMYGGRGIEVNFDRFT